MTESEVATLGGGCFWCIEAVYLDLKGVEKVVSGYSGGPDPNPTYREVTSGMTGHAEVVQITYNPEIVSFKELVVGRQYRSVIFYHTEMQKQASEDLIKFLEHEKVFPNPIVTDIISLDKFYIAEDYHQNYYAKNPSQGYCRVVIAPKVNKFRQKYLNKLKLN
ncbi:MAG: peptide-methionine (S)-S-oxide reductase [Candidatus Kariarchaeaceae archaeon]|jgi:peptide-methionine (S)-S-oxide reductase